VAFFNSHSAQVFLNVPFFARITEKTAQKNHFTPDLMQKIQVFTPDLKQMYYLCNPTKIPIWRKNTAFIC